MVCDTGGHPMYVDTQDEKLREIQYRNFIWRIDNFLNVSTEELKIFSQ